MWVKREQRNNQVDEQSRRLLEENTMYIMRNKYDKTPLGISFSEQGLRSVATKMGVYPYCKGRVTNFKDAQKAERSPNIIIERFLPLDNTNDSRLMSKEIHWITQAKRMLTANSNAFYHTN